MNHFRSPLLLLIPFFALAMLPAGRADEPAVDPKETLVRSISALKITFKTWIFEGNVPPTPEFEQPAEARKLLGNYTITTKYFDQELTPIQAATYPGLYAAVVTVSSPDAPTFQRYFTLYRAPGKIDANARRELDIHAVIIKRQSEIVASVLKNRTLPEFATDPQAAKLFAGLSLSSGEDTPIRKYDDVYANERRWWVLMKRKLAGMSVVPNKPFICPVVMEGKGARKVREGTLDESGMKADAVEKIDAVLTEWAADDDQAFAVCIVRHGVIVLHKAYGMRDGKPMTVTTKSWMASITKSMSATLMMELVDQKLVDLDDPIEKFLPAFADRSPPTPLRIRHLYNHTSGLDKWLGEWNQDAQSDIDARVALAYPHLKVGIAWGYGGQGYVLGGKVIEMVSGEAIPQFFQRHLLGPLGCENTDVVGTHADAFSVPLDIAKFGQMLLNQGAYGQYRFFQPETFEKMLPRVLTKELGPDAKKTFGIGLDGSPEKFGHGAASAATFQVDRTNDMVVVMTRNKMGKNQGKYNGKFFDALKAAIDTTK